MLPEHVDVLVEVPRFGWVKRTAAGGVDFVSPVPCPFNYGCVPDLPSGDGDPLDAVLLGPHQPRGAVSPSRVWGVVRFVDNDDVDDKLICGPSAPTDWDWWVVRTFFRVYGPAKGLLNRARGKRGATGMLRLETTP